MLARSATKRRYLFQANPAQMPEKHYDVVVVGGGVAGLYSALLLDDKLSCAVLIKDRLHRCNSSLAQGGVAAVTTSDDDLQQHLHDTLKAGDGLTSQHMAEIMIKGGPDEIARLTSFGVSFDTGKDGSFRKTKEGGHTRKRVLHCGGDATGRHMVEQLAKVADKKANVDIFEDHFMVDILTDKHNQACGVVAISGSSPVLFLSPEVVVATGGIGQIYRNTTNRIGITGDGIAAAQRAGALCHHMEFVQFHPTAFYDQTTGQSSFLISEAVRGEGAVLRNQSGEAFMADRHPMKDLAPRDKVAREIFFEMQRDKSSHVFLDITMHDKEFLSNRFPTIYKECRDRGINMATDFIPVSPVQHYFMGGIRTNDHGETSIKRLLACGEAACTEAHGANRLASNSLLECLVFSRQVATRINQSTVSPNQLPDIQLDHTDRKTGNLAAIRKQVQDIMQMYGGIIRSEKGLARAQKNLQVIMEQLESSKLETREELETYNIAQLSSSIVAAALERKENIGAHYRIDL